MESIKELADDIYRERVCVPANRPWSNDSRLVSNCLKVSTSGCPPGFVTSTRKRTKIRFRRYSVNGLHCCVD